MTRRDYILLARSFRRMIERANECSASVDVCLGIVLTIRQVAADLYADNPRFDIEQFYQDCGTLLQSAITYGIELP